MNKCSIRLKVGIILAFLLHLCRSGPIYNTDQPYSYLVSRANSTSIACQGGPSSSSDVNSICSPFIAFPSNTCVQRYDDLVPPDFNLSLVMYSSVDRVLGVLGDVNYRAQDALGNYVIPEDVNVSGIAMVISGDEYYGMYPEDIAKLAGNRGFKAVIMVIEGKNSYASLDLDESAVASMALRFWRVLSAPCQVPVYFVSGALKSLNWRVSSNTSGAILETGNVLHLTFHLNTEAVWLKTAGFLGGTFVPGVLMAVGLACVAFYKLWKKGAPYAFNPGICVMYLGLAQAFIFGIVISDSVRRAPNLSYTTLYICLTLFVIASVASTFLIGFFYHISLIRSNGRRFIGCDVPIALAVCWTTVCLIAFIITQAGIIAQVHYLDTRLSVPASILYLCFRVFSTVYFIHGQWKAMKIFQNSSITAGTTSPNITGRRLGYIAFANLLNITLTVMIAARWYKVDHGWALVLWSGILLLLTTMMEILAIPSPFSRKDILARLRKSLSGNKAIRKNESNSVLHGRAHSGTFMVINEDRTTNQQTTTPELSPTRQLSEEIISSENQISPAPSNLQSRESASKSIHGNDSNSVRLDRAQSGTFMVIQASADIELESTAPPRPTD